MRWSHLVAGGVVGILLPVVAMPGCESVLGLDGYRGAADELCDLYEQCYGTGTFSACLQHVQAQLEGAEGTEVNAWLTTFGNEDCLESCGAARACLDLEPVCGDASFDCSADEQCCGFTSGLGACLDAQCCKDDGADCAEDAECCGQVCAMPPGGTVETCGAIDCANVGEACENDPDCCSEVCSPDSGTCAAACLDELGASCTEDIECCTRLCVDRQCACASAGQPCESGANCCGGFCDANGVCKEDCKLSGGSCSGADECCSADCLNDECCGGVGDSCESDPDCCGDNCLLGECACSRRGASCVAEDDCCPLAGDCVDGTCVCGLAGDACESITDCCTGLCVAGQCRCAPMGADCEGDGDCCSDVCQDGACSCRSDGMSCILNDSCCSDRCSGGKCCVSPPSSCNTAASNPCVAQAKPLNLDCLPAAGRACVVSVCQLLPHCCCQLWDQACVQSFKNTPCDGGSVGSCAVNPDG